MNIINITYPDINNGLGTRVTIWFAGCPFHCKECHNQTTWDYNQGTQFSIEKTLQDLDRLFRDRPYLAGITLSGGDPLNGKTDYDLTQLQIFLQKFKDKFPTKNVWIYSGAYYETLLKNNKKKTILSYCDILVDGPYEHNKRDIRLAFRGSSNQRIIDLHTGDILYLDKQ